MNPTITLIAGLNRFGDRVHSSMYQSMFANSPNEFLEYPDYSVAHHFGCQLPTYLPRELIHDYLKGQVMVKIMEWLCKYILP